MKSYLFLLRLYLVLSGTVFVLVAFFHLFRLLSQWPIVVGATVVPQFLSYVGLPASTAYAVCAFWLLHRAAKLNPSRPAS